MTIYRELENQINMKKLKIPRHELLMNEMMELQRRFTYNGFKVFPKQGGDGVKSDDACDTLAGAVFETVNQKASKLPLLSVTVTMVLLKLARMCTCPCGTARRLFFLLVLAFGASAVCSLTVSTFSSVFSISLSAIIILTS